MIVEIKRSGFVQRLGFDEFERRVRDGEVPADVLVRFEPVTGDAFKPAGELEFYRETADPDRLAFRRNLTRVGLPLVTALMVGLQLRVFVWSLGTDRKLWLQEHFANWGPAVFEGSEVWRLFTYSFLHAGFAHILMNVCFLAYAGYHIERALGHRNTLTVYTGSVFGGGLLSLLMSPKRYSLGASGGVMGLIGATIVLGWKHWDQIPDRSRKYFGWALSPYLIWTTLSGIRDAEQVDNWCHLGGFIGGALLATLLDPDVLRRRKQANAAWTTLAVAIMGGLSAALVWAGTGMVPLSVEEDGAWKVSRPSYWQPGWTLTGDRGWFSPTLQSNVAITRTRHPGPLTPAQAVDALVARIQSGTRDVVVLRRMPVEIDGVQGLRVQLSFRRAETIETVDAVVLVRGNTELRVVLQATDAEQDRYAPLMRRIVGSLAVGPDEAVTVAEQRVSNHPRSWTPQVALGDALRDAGEPLGALDAYHEALWRSPGEPKALEGLLRTCRDYVERDTLPCGAVVPDAMRRAGDHPRVIVAASEVLRKRGDNKGADTILDDGWRLLPGDRTLRRARRRAGLSTALLLEER